MNPSIHTWEIQTLLHEVAVGPGSPDLVGGVSFLNPGQDGYLSVGRCGRDRRLPTPPDSDVQYLEEELRREIGKQPHDLSLGSHALDGVTGQIVPRLLQKEALMCCQQRRAVSTRMLLQSSMPPNPPWVSMGSVGDGVLSDTQGVGCTRFVWAHWDGCLRRPSGRKNPTRPHVEPLHPSSLQRSSHAPWGLPRLRSMGWLHVLSARIHNAPAFAEPLLYRIRPHKPKAKVAWCSRALAGQPFFVLYHLRENQDGSRIQRSFLGGITRLAVGSSEEIRRGIKHGGKSHGRNDRRLVLHSSTE